MRFLAPTMLWGLAALPLLIAAYVLIQRRRKAYAIRFTNLDLLASVAPKRPGWRRHVAPVLMLMTTAALIGALARPVIPVLVPREQSSIMLVIDVSRSMYATDLEPDRMEAAKSAAADFVESLPPGIQVGVVAFSNFSSLESPLTRDREHTLGAIANLNPIAGTAMGEGLFTALAEIDREREEGKEVPASILLLSDGASNLGRSPAEATELASEMDIPVFTIGIGTEGATLEVFGRSLPVDLDEDQLRAVAEATGAEFFKTPDEGSLKKVYEELGSALGYERSTREATAEAAGLGLFLLLAAAACSLLWFHRFP